MATAVGDLVVNLGCNTLPYEAALNRAQGKLGVFIKSVKEYDSFMQSQQIIGRFDLSLAAKADALAALEPKVAVASRAISSLRAVFDGLHPIVGRAQSAIMAFGARAAHIGFNIAAASAAMATYAAVVGTIGLGETFERQFRGATAIMEDMSSVMVSRMKEKAYEVASTFAMAPAEVAKGYEALAQAGLSAQDVLQSLPTVAAFASAGSMDMKKSAEYLTQSLYALNLPLREMPQLAGVLTEAAIRSTASIDDFAQALAGPAAGALRITNKGMVEGVAILAAYAQKGIKGADASQWLSIALRDVQRAALRNATTHRELHDAVYDAYGRMRDMSDIVGWLEKRLGGMTVEQRSATMAMYDFQEKSKNALLALLGSSKAIKEFEENLDKHSRTTEIATKKITELQRAWADLKIGATEAGNAVEGALGGIALWAVTALSPMTSLAEKKRLLTEQFIRENNAEAVTALRKPLETGTNRRFGEMMKAGGGKRPVSPEQAAVEHALALQNERIAMYDEALQKRMESLKSHLTELYTKEQSPLERYQASLKTLNEGFKRFPTSIEEYRKALQALAWEYNTASMKGIREEYKSVFEKALTPMEHYKRNVADINRVFSQGTMGLKERNELLREANEIYKAGAAKEYEQLLEREHQISEKQAEPLRKRTEEMHRFAERAREAGLTPKQDLIARLKKIGEAVKEGFLSPEEGKAAAQAEMKRAREHETLPEGPRVAVAARAGTAEAWSTIVRSAMGQHLTKGERQIITNLQMIRDAVKEAGIEQVLDLPPGGLGV